MTAQPIPQTITSIRAHLADVVSEPSDAAAYSAAIMVVAAGDTRIAVIDLLTHPCGQHLLDDIASTGPARGDTAWPGPRHLSSLMTIATTARADASPLPTLTGRERDVLELVTHGLTNQEIAARLYLSVNTIKTYVRLAYRKVGVSNRAQAVAWGYQNGLQGAHRADD